MASVVSKTSVKVDELLGPLVVSAAFQSNGHLLLTTRDGTMLDAGAATTPVLVASWDAAATYKFGDVVAYIGRIWMYTDVTPSANVVPVLNTDRWQGLGSVDSSAWVQNDAHFDGVSLAKSWSAITQAGVATATLTTTAGEFETGPRALKISLGVSSTLAVTQLDENIVHGGEVITVTVRAKLVVDVPSATFGVKLYQNDGTGRPIAGAAGVVSTDALEGTKVLSGSWANYTFTVNAVNNKIRGLIELRAFTGGTAAVVLIDSIKVARASTPALAPWPVGSIFMSVSSSNPADLLGGGVWVKWSSGRVPVGVDTASTQFTTVEQTGGEINHVLTIPEMPLHDHSMIHGHSGGTTSSDGSHDHSLDRGTGTGSSTLSIPKGVTTVDIASASAIANDGAHSHSVTVGSYSGNTGATGSASGGHNNLQPYITCYMWKRTA